MKIVRRYYRNKPNRSLFGVCAGLEDYTGKDRVMWRILFVALFLYPYFPSILFYILVTLFTSYERKN